MSVVDQVGTVLSLTEIEMFVVKVLLEQMLMLHSA
jgi:hypothetical protein